MSTTKWFDRKFDFNFGTEQFADLLQRLRVAPELYQNEAALLPDQILSFKEGDKWSVKENVGHLFILEPVWLKRFKEIKEGQPEMSPADLNNTATHKASFNALPVAELLQTFSSARKETIHFLENLKEKNLNHSSLHPRIKQKMRMIDLMYFVAEHDAHHLQTIKELLKKKKL